MGTLWSDLRGTVKSLFSIGRATLSASALTAARTLTLPDLSGTVVVQGGGGAVPAGGALGQVLAKSAAGDYALAWETEAVKFLSVEVNLGYPARRSGTFTIAGLTGLTPGKPVMIWLARGPYTGKGTSPGEESMYAGQFTGVVASTTTITVSFALSSRIGGVIKFNYLIGA